MRIRHAFLLIIIVVVMIFSFCLNGMGTVVVNASHGIYMKVSGKVIQEETGLGIPSIQILLYEIISGENYFANTNQDGSFMVRKVPPGIYQISETFVNQSCPAELIVSEMPEMIKVSTGKNVLNLKISLKKGATISGYVYAADGATPLKDVEITAEPWIYGRGEPVYTDHQGKYILKGLVDGDKLVHASAQGFEHESIDLIIKPGEDIGNINFILGRGNVSVKGKVVSLIDNQPVKNAYVSFIYQYPDQKYSAGWAKTDDNGDYSLNGLKHPGTFEISIAHDEYDEPDSYTSLSYGENSINLELTTKYGLPMTNFVRKYSSDKDEANTRYCCDDPNYNHNYSDIQNEMCKLLIERGDCVGDDIVLECLKHRCDERNYTIICDKKCPPEASGRTKKSYINISKEKTADIFLCTNNKVHSIDEIMEAILHELFHICDRGGSRERTFCAEWRAYRATYCIFKNPSSKKYKMVYKIKCYECLLKKKDCNP